MITIEIVFFLLLQVFSSSIAGYITNKYAVNMIFKEYTPLKIGGAVKKNKEKFIEEISDLVERDIINSSTIKNSVLDENFKQAMNNASKDFFEKSLYEVFKNTKLEDIPGIEGTLNNGHVLLRETLETMLPKVLNNTTNHIKIDDLLTNDQIYVIVNYIYEEIIDKLNKNDEYRHLIDDLYNDQSDITLNQFISKETSEKLTRIVSCEIINAIDELLDSKKETKILIDKVFSLIDIKSILKNLQKSLGSKSLEEILGEEGLDNLSLIIYEKLDELIKTEDGKLKIKSIVEDIFVSAKNIDLTIFEVLPLHFGRTSSEYLVDLIKKAIPYLISWIRDNQELIEKIIDESIFESIDNIDDDLRKSMILKLKDTMLNDFSSRNQIVDKMIDFLTSNEISQQSSSKIYAKVIKFLEDTKIKDLVDILHENNLINEEIVTEFILNKWKDEGKNISKILLKQQSLKTLNKLIDQDFNKLFNKNIKPKIYDSISDNKNKIISYLDNILFDLVQNKIQSMLDNKLSDLFKEEEVGKFSNIFYSKIIKLLNINKKTYEKNIENIIYDYVKNIKLETLVKNNEESLVNLINDSIIGFTKDSMDKYKSYELNGVIDKLNRIEGISENISENIYNESINNLSSIVDGNVKKVIYNNLIKLDEDEICNIAQSFMGKQLKPLSMFGAFLGAIVGLIFGITMQNINGSYGFYNNLQNTLIACLIMGGIGIMTNVIALWMIFCPYEKNKFIAKIPIFRIFSIGYIPSHKNSFALGMAHFIDNELLSGSRVASLFSFKKDELEDNISRKIISSKYIYILDFIKNKKQKISKSIYKFILKTVRKNNGVITNLICNKLLSLECNKFIPKDLINNKAIYYLDNLNQFESRVISYFEEKLKNNKSMEEVLPIEVINAINQKMNNDINDFISSKMETDCIEEVIKNIILKNENIYNKFIEKTMKDIISEKSLLSIKDNMKTDKFINTILLTLKEQLNSNLQKYLDKEFNSEKRFDEILDGKIKNKLDKEIYNLTEKVIDKLVELIKDNNDLISSIVIKMVRKNLNFLVKMAYDFADGDGLVRAVINNVIENKIEHILNEDKDKISVILYSYLENEIYPSRIKDLGIQSIDINTSLILDRLVFGLKQNEDFNTHVYDSADLIIDNISEIKAIDIAKVLEIDDINVVYDKCRIPLNVSVQELISNLNDKQNEVNEFISQLVNDKVMKHFYSISLVEISWELNVDDISYTVDNLFNIISNSKIVHSYVSHFSYNLYEHSLKNIKLEEILDKERLVKDINNSLSIIFENKDFNERNKSIVENIIEIVNNNNLEFISDESKSYFTQQITSAGLNTVERNIIPMLQSINLQKITLEEVEKMHPKEIHLLFKSFAGDFFIKLYIYGFFGFVFGVNVYLSIILSLLDIIYTKKTEEKAKNSSLRIFKK